MALDKLVDSTQLDSDLGDVADAIRAKSGGSGQLVFPSGFISEIGNISGGGGVVGITQDQDGYLVLSPTLGQWSDFTFSTFTFTPNQEYGRVATGGYPNAISYILSLLPSGWRFARVRYKSGTKEDFLIGEIGLCYYYVCADDAKPFSWIRWKNGAWENMTVTGSNPTGYGALLSPNCVFEVDVLSAPLLVS